MTRILHAADLHLDSRLRGLQRYPGAPDYDPARATRDALARMVELALDHQVHVVIIAGDIYEGDWQDWNTGLFFLQQIGRLIREGIPVVCIRGNHDAAHRITRGLRPPEHCYILQHEKPESVRFPKYDLVVHGQSYATARMDRNLAAHYPAAEQGMINVGLLHTALNGREGHEPYAPCHPDHLLEKGYHYWALGHVHQFEVVQGTDGRVVFAGNTQGRHIRETGPKGAVLVDIDAAGNVRLQRLLTHKIRWELLNVPVTDARQFSDVLDRIEQRLSEAVSSVVEEELLAVRVVLAGATALDGQLRLGRSRLKAEARQLAQQLSESVWIEDIRVQTQLPERRGTVGAIWQELLAELTSENAIAQQEITELVGSKEIDALRRGLARVMDPERVEQWWREQTGRELLLSARAYLDALLREA